MKHCLPKILSLNIAILITLTFASCGMFRRTETPTDEATPDTAALTQAAASEDTQTGTAKTPQESATVSTQEDDIIYYSAKQPTAALTPEEVLSLGSSNPGDIYDAAGFVSVSDVIPDAVTDIRYASTYNFVGDVINGYDEPVAVLTKEAAAALMGAADALREQGYRIKIYDAYRPQRAVNHFVSWSNDWSDTKMKSDFYPELDKSVLFDYGYIAYYSGHSRGSTIDLSLVYADSGEDVDMGGTFDYFGTLSHPDYTGITSEQYDNRMVLREAMINNGFSPLSTEWWHFTLNGEPYPNTYFDFPVSSDVLSSYP